MTAPIIAAGENLSFWPIGVLAASRRRVLHPPQFPRGHALPCDSSRRTFASWWSKAFTIEFFLEGGRSRTGKAAASQSTACCRCSYESASKLHGTKVKLVPVSIGYERIIEERSFVHELSGGDKQSENVSDLIKSSSILRSKWGRLYVQFGEIIDFDEFQGGDDGALTRRTRSSIGRHHAPINRRTRFERIGPQSDVLDQRGHRGDAGCAGGHRTVESPETGHDQGFSVERMRGPGRHAGCHAGPDRAISSASQRAAFARTRSTRRCICS